MRTRLGHYDIVAELGRGGMGVVYKGHEPALNRYVAIKVLADALAHDEAVKERFLREARSMAALNDPHIIQIYFIGDDEGQTYFVMEFVEGESLGLMLEVVKAEIPDVREINADVDPEIALILDRMIAKDPAERYQNCHELISELSVHPLVAKGGPISLKPKIST